MIVIGIASLVYDTINDRFATKPTDVKSKKGHEKKKKGGKAHKGGSHW